MNLTQHSTALHSEKKGDEITGNCPPNLRARAWAFTLFNYDDEDIKTLCRDTYCFQEEKCPTTGNMHLQGTIYFKNPRTFSSLCKWIPNCRWRPCKNLIGSYNYCSKETTRAGKLYSNVDLSKYNKFSGEENMKVKKTGRELLAEQIEGETSEVPDWEALGQAEVQKNRWHEHMKLICEINLPKHKELIDWYWRTHFG